MHDQVYFTELLVLQPTPYCNLRCSYCYLPDRGNRSRMDFNLPKDAISYLVSSNLAPKHLSICWHAGEPMAAGLAFYHNALREIEETHFPFSLSHSMQTNATLMNKNWGHFFQQKNFSIGVSLDGPKHLHDAHRRFGSKKGSFDLTVNGLKMLQDFGINPSVIAVVTKKTLPHAEEFYTFFKDLGITRLGLNIEEDEGIHRSKIFKTNNFTKEYSYFFKNLYNISKGGSLKIREIERMTDRILYFSKRKSEITNVQTEPCRILSVDHQGNFSTFSPELLGNTHPSYPSFILGNIYKNPIDEVLSSELYLKMLSEIQGGIQKCKTSCQYFPFCGGGAPSNKLWENGSFESTITGMCTASIQIPMDLILPALEKEFLESKKDA